MALWRRPAGGGGKPPNAALAEDRRGERLGKGAPDASGGDREDVPETTEAPSSLLKCRKPLERHRKRGKFDPGEAAWRVPVNWPGGVRHGDGVSPVCGFCTEREKARRDTSW